MFQNAKEQTRDLIDQTTKLQNERFTRMLSAQCGHVHLVIFYSQRVVMKADVVEAFLKKYQLNPNEIDVLRGSKGQTLHMVETKS